ncbi:MAG: peptidoglycan DD-metalloendopeptidase family protein [Aridibacter famidurans]|nr:peptidoglycan DD-metalloendopeptidase family protein [Aridibacter famidurans]
MIRRIYTHLLLVSIYTAVSVAAALLLLPSCNQVSAQEARLESEKFGGRSFDYGQVDRISEEENLKIQKAIEENIEMLSKAGRIRSRVSLVGKIQLAWPTQKAPGVTDFNIGQIPYYVDQQPAFPNQTLDWNCGTRTYDRADGYNHSGTDIVSFPFPWKRMVNNEVFAVAAASGTIVLKQDGHPDNNCVSGNFPVNSIHILHRDGSIGWYLHLKKDSLTSKSEGDTVDEGEFLGVVGSSGNSTVPHLHFELYDSEGNLQDPFEGPCNSLNSFSWWKQQEPYRNSRINTMMTGSAQPQFPACPSPEITNEKTVFRPLDPLVTTAFFRDLQSGQRTDFEIIKPDGSIFSQWGFTSQNTFNAHFRFANWQLEADAPRGVWKYRANLDGTLYEIPFAVKRAPFDFDGDNKTDVAIYRSPDCGGGRTDPSGTNCTPTWWILRSSDLGVRAQVFYSGHPAITPEDFTGDGKADIAFFDQNINQANRQWYVLRSEDSSYYSFEFGSSGDIAAPGDFDWDGRSDPAVFRPANGTWYIVRSSDQEIQIVQFGAPGDKPTVADFDGDGVDDFGIFRPDSGQWWQLRSREGVKAFEFGTGTDRTAVGDYTGDGKADIAFFRPATGEWFVLRSEDDSYFAFSWGTSSDVPAPGDYDGDGIYDPAVFRTHAVEGTWYILGSTSGFQTVQFGSDGADTPVPSAYSRTGPFELAPS